jgi:hypothetical protein
MAAAQREEQDALLSDVLRHVDKTAAVPPLLVVQLLAENGALPFGLVREFMIKRVAADEERLADDARAVDGLRADTEAMLGEVHRLDTAARVFQTRKCRLCGIDLDLPSVHFMCGGLAGEEHSFHAHCINDAEPECPVCAPVQRSVREIRASLGGARPGQAEQFFHELGSAPDGFLKCAEYFSKGLFDGSAGAAGGPPAGLPGASASGAGGAGAAQRA